MGLSLKTFDYCRLNQAVLFKFLYFYLVDKCLVAFFYDDNGRCSTVFIVDFEQLFKQWSEYLHLRLSNLL